MNLFERKYKFVTNAALAGADQTKAEIRIASVRGALRWWFRLLSGETDCREIESDVFGCVHPKSQASKLKVSLGQFDDISKSKTVVTSGNLPKGYQYILWPIKTNNVQRELINHEFSFSLKYDLLRLLENPKTEALIKDSIDAFGLFGSLGTASRKCFGSLQEEMYTDMSIDEIKRHNIVDRIERNNDIRIEWLDKCNADSSENAISKFSDWLKDFNNRPAIKEIRKMAKRKHGRFVWPFSAKVVQAKEGYFVAICVFKKLMSENSYFKDFDSFVDEVLDSKNF